jgi:GNAT superfamily N-acetyltransferase
VTLPPAERGELEAFRSLFAAWDGGNVSEVGGALCTAAGQLPRSALFNRALALGLAAPATDDALDEVEAFFSRHRVSYVVTLAPGAQPPDLAQRLARRGFERGYAWTKFELSFARDLDHKQAEPAAAPPGLRVERVGAGGASAFADVFERAYGTPPVARPAIARAPSLPGWHCFVAFAGDTPVATGALCVAGDVGWLGMAGTLPAFQGRGAQSAILVARIDAAREAGCTTLVTETGTRVDRREGPSYRNIVRAGFEPVYVRENYLSAGDADTSGALA